MEGTVRQTALCWPPLFGPTAHFSPTSHVGPTAPQVYTVYTSIYGSTVRCDMIEKMHSSFDIPAFRTADRAVSALTWVGYYSHLLHTTH